MMQKILIKKMREEWLVGGHCAAQPINLTFAVSGKHKWRADSSWKYGTVKI